MTCSQQPTRVVKTLRNCYNAGRPALLCRGPGSVNREYNFLMSTAHFLILGRLNDFLPRDQREQRIRVDFRGRQSIKHLAESLGVPHPEIGQVWVNRQEAALDAITQDGDQVEMHPIPDSCPVEPRFVLDNHLGRLAA